MKRFLFTLSALCLLCPLQAQYRLYAYKGAVEFKSKTAGVTDWTRVQENMNLSSSDSLRIPKGGSVRIEHVKPHNIYTTFKEGAASVFSIIEKAKSENARHICSGLNKEMATGRTTTMEMRQMTVLGASSRSTGEEDNTERMAESFAWIGALVCSGSRADKEEGLHLQKHFDGDEWTFEMENATDKDYYLNVIHINKQTNTVSLCYVLTMETGQDSCPLTKSGYSTYIPYLLFPNTEDDVYVLVATEEAYDSFAVNNELSFLSVDKAQAPSLTIKYTW